MLHLFVENARDLVDQEGVVGSQRAEGLEVGLTARQEQLFVGQL